MATWLREWLLVVVIGEWLCSRFLWWCCALGVARCAIDSDEVGKLLVWRGGVVVGGSVGGFHCDIAVLGRVGQPLAR